MTRARSLRFASLALAAAAFSAGLVALPSAAQADRVRVRVGASGEVHVRGRAHVRIGGPRVVVRPRVYARYPRHYRYRPYVYVRPYPLYPYWAPYWHFRYAAPPPPTCYAECGPPVDAYYAAPPPPVAVREPEPLPRLGLGIFAGAVGVENNDEPGADIGLIGRLRLTRHFILEAEISKTEIDDGVRVDRRVGGALLYDFAPYSSLKPYILAGGGFGQTDVNDGTFTAEQAYGELGIGLELVLGRHISLFGDLRGGVRASNAEEEDIVFLRESGGNPPVDDDERFTRARIGALLTF